MAKGTRGGKGGKRPTPGAKGQRGAKPANRPKPKDPAGATAAAAGGGQAPGGSQALGGSQAGGRPKPTRAERLEAERAARRRRARRNRLLSAVAVVAIVAAISAAVVLSRRGEQRVVDQVTAGSCEYDERFDRDAGTGRNHVQNPVYSVDPPAGGNHAPSAAPAGRYTVETAPPDGQIVHAMEHGFIVVWHRPELSEADQEAIADLASRFQRELLVVPRPSLTVPVAVTAWHRRALCERVEPEAIAAFVRNFRDQGPEKGFL